VQFVDWLTGETGRLVSVSTSAEPTLSIDVEYCSVAGSKSSPMQSWLLAMASAIVRIAATVLGQDNSVLVTFTRTNSIRSANSIPP
jgi:hypothetical protein